MHDDILDVLMLAAMSESFDPQRLVLMLPEGRRDEALAALASDSTEIEHEEGYAWRATSGARRRLLKDATPENLRRVLDRAPQLDPLGTAFRDVATNGQDSADTAREPLYDAVELLRLAEASMPFDLGALSRTLYHQLNRKAADSALGIVLRSPLRGRKDELDLLLRHAAGELQDQAAKGKNSLLRTLRTPPEGVTALLVTGIGGIGKSALVAEAIRRLRGESWQGHVVIHFDFDLPSLKGGNPAALTLELARQITLARPALDELMSQSRESLRAASQSAPAGTSGSFDIMYTTLGSQLSGWSADVNAQCGQLVFVLDTLEELAVISPALVSQLFDWLLVVGTCLQMPRVPVIALGRALDAHQVETYFSAELPLDDLAPPAARAMLKDLLGEKAQALVGHVDQCVETFGGNPLVLKILASYAKERPENELAELLADAAADKANGLTGEFAQKYLYTRLLDRVRDPEVKPLAHPGLVLRRVTVELICEVLAEPCGLAPIDRERAEALLRRLEKQVWLVSPDGSNGVRHRRDVRRLMLPQVLQAPKTQQAAREVNERAARWFEQQASATNRYDPLRLEGWYHRALLRDSLEDLKAADLVALADHLGEDVADLPRAVVARMRHAQGRVLSNGELALLPEADRADAADKRTHKLATSGLESVVVADWSHRRVRDITPQSWTWEPIGVPTPSAETIKSLFADGEFETVGRWLPALYLDFVQRYRSGSKSRVSNPLDEPIYLSAIATRAFGPPVGLSELEPLAGDSLSQGERYQASPGFFDDLALWRVALKGKVAANIEAAAIGRLKKAWKNKTIEKIADWRIFLAHALSIRRFADTVSVRTDNLAFLDNELLSAISMGLTPAERSYAKLILPGNTHANRSGGDSPGAWQAVLLNVSGLIQSIDAGAKSLPILDSSLQAVDLLAKAASEVVVGLRLPTAEWRPPTAVRLLGLTPEFYGPARSALRTLKTMGALHGTVDRLARETAFWPHELAPANVSPQTLGALAPVLVRVCDYFGVFGKLLRYTADAAPGNSAMQRVVKVFDAFESAWEY